MAIPFLNNITLNNNEVQNVKLHNTGSAPNNAAGQVYFNTSDNLAKYYSNATDLWVSLKEYSFSNGTYVDVATAGTTVKPILTLDISAIDGTAGAGERYLTKSNTWAEVSAIPGTYSWTVAAETGSEAISSGDTVTFIGGNVVSTSYNSTTNELSIAHESVTRTDTTSTDSGNTHGDTFTVVDSVTSSSEGHITAINVKTVSFPASDNTDTTYDLSVQAGGANTSVIRLADSHATNDDVTISGTSTTVKVTEDTGTNTITLDLQDDVTIVNDLTVGGDINVTGSLNSYTTSELLVQDQYVTLNSGQATPVLDAFLKVERGTTDVAVKWNETTDRWQFTNDGTTYYNIPISSEYDNFSFSVQVGATSQEVSNGGTLTFAQGGGLTVAIGGDDTITYSHEDTSSASSVDNSGLTVIQDLTIDTYGHITAIGSADITSSVTSVITGREYVTTITDTATVTHSLGSRDVMVQLYDVTTYETVYADVERTTTSAVDITFASTPTNSIRVLITKIG